MLGREYILGVLRRTGGNKSRAAELLSSMTLVGAMGTF
jgi:regulatory Fis family protein